MNCFGRTEEVGKKRLGEAGQVSETFQAVYPLDKEAGQMFQ